MLISRRFTPSFAITALALLLLGILVLNPSVWGYPRKVLLEDFTNVGCGPCISLAPALNAAIEATSDVVIPIGIHVYWPDRSDPFYIEYNDGYAGRDGFYGGVVGNTGVPYLFLNGTVCRDRTQQSLTNSIRQRSQVESPLSIDLRGSVRGTTLSAHVEVTAEEAVSSCRLFVALVENYSHYPVAGRVNDNYDALMRMLPSSSGTAFSVEANESQSFDFEMNIAGVGWDDPEVGNMSLISWVQRINNPREVLQVTRFGFPAINIPEWEISDAQGNEDGRAEPGETASFALVIENTSEDADLPPLTGTLSCYEDLINVNDVVWELGALGAGSSANNFENPFSFTVSEDFIPKATTFDVTFTTEEGEEFLVFSVEFTVGWPQFLLIDASKSERAAEEISEMFGENAVLPFADYYNREESGIVTAEVLGSYPAVIWFTFNSEEDIFSAWEQEEIMGYLNNGGTFILCSQAFIRTAGQQPIMHRYLAAILDQEDVGNNYIHGINNSNYFGGMHLFTGGQNANCAGFPEFKPSLTPLQGGHPVLVWGENDEDNLGVAAVERITDTYKTLTLAFPIESLCGYMRTDSRASFMSYLWDWHINDGAGAPVEPANIPARFGLETAYPNPFNSGAIVPFNLTQSGMANLALFDLNGRQITTLFNGSLSAGSHVLNMNGNELGLVSGYYVLRLNANEASDMQRVLYLK